MVWLLQALNVLVSREPHQQITRMTIPQVLLSARRPSWRHCSLYGLDKWQDQQMGLDLDAEGNPYYFHQESRALYLVGKSEDNCGIIFWRIENITIKRALF